jgi:hypothetical protein
MPGHSSIRLLLHPRARAELLEATRYYREKKPEVAAAFLKEVRRCGELIAVSGCLAGGFGQGCPPKTSQALPL